MTEQLSELDERDLPEMGAMNGTARILLAAVQRLTDENAALADELDRVRATCAIEASAAREAATAADAHRREVEATASRVVAEETLDFPKNRLALGEMVDGLNPSLLGEWQEFFAYEYDRDTEPGDRLEGAA